MTDRVSLGQACTPARAPVPLRLEATAQALLAPLIEAGRGDLVDDYAGPLTVATVAMLLGVEEGDVETLGELSRFQAQLMSAVGVRNKRSAKARAAYDEALASISELLKSKTLKGCASVPLPAQLADIDLTGVDRAHSAAVLLIAGHATTASLIAHSIYSVMQHPRYLVRLRNDESFALTFLEEVLRTRPAAHRKAPAVTADAKLLGAISVPVAAQLPAFDGQVVDNTLMIVPSDLARLSLGSKPEIYSCLGNWLARLEGAAALSVFARSVELVSFDPDAPLTPATGGEFDEIGVEHLRVLLRPLCSATVRH